MVDVCAELGGANVAVANVVARAGVSRRTFYEIFESREDCFLAAFDQGIAGASRYVADAYDPRTPWVDRIRTAVSGLLGFLDTERVIGKLLVVESLGMGTAALERRQRVTAELVAVVDDGRKDAKNGSRLPPLTAEGVVGGALSVLHSRLLVRGGGSLLELTGPLMSMIVLPYRGTAVAQRELKRPVSKPAGERGPALADPLRDLEMRLTYRTVRVLLAIADASGASNRQIAVAAGIADQGQISKLLARLQRLGLVENLGLTPGKGAPNSWALTKRGLQVARGMVAEATYLRGEQ